MITQIAIRNYRAFRSLDLQFTPGMNILVGDNDAGKSTVLEAVGLALTLRLRGRALQNELSPFLFNAETTKDYTAALRAGHPVQPPEILIDLFFDKSAPAALKGRTTSTALMTPASGSASVSTRTSAPSTPSTSVAPMTSGSYRRSTTKSSGSRSQATPSPGDRYLQLLH